jgi:hypothetical protein
MRRPAAGSTAGGPPSDFETILHSLLPVTVTRSCLRFTVAHDQTRIPDTHRCLCCRSTLVGILCHCPAGFGTQKYRQFIGPGPSSPRPITVANMLALVRLGHSPNLRCSASSFLRLVHHRPNHDLSEAKPFSWISPFLPDAPPAPYDSTSCCCTRMASENFYESDMADHPQDTSDVW